MNKREAQEYLNSLSPEELQEIANHGAALIDPIIDRMMTDTAGTFPCKLCGGSGTWSRIGRDWKAECGCGWNAAGSISANKIAN